MRARRLWGLPVRLRRLNLKLVFAFFVVLGAVVAQDPTSYLTPDVTRVGARLACRCGGCRNTVGNCPMLRCSSADPMRHRIYEMKSRGMSDDDVVNSIVREEGVVALSSPPANSLAGLMTWLMPGVALLAGFFIYSRYVRRNRKAPQPLSVADQATMDRFRAQIETDFEDPPARNTSRANDER